MIEPWSAFWVLEVRLRWDALEWVRRTRVFHEPLGTDKQQRQGKDYGRERKQE